MTDIEAGLDGTPVEVEVARVWAELLGTAPTSVHDDFFDLGGQSLTFVRFLARVEETYGAELAVDELLDAGLTVAVAAAAIEKSRLGSASDSEVDELLTRLDGMSEADVAALLGERS